MIKAKQTQQKNQSNRFSTPTCTYCNTTKNYFRQNRVRFRDVDVSRDQAAARDMVRRSRQTSVPVIDIGGKIIVARSD